MSVRPGQQIDVRFTTQDADGAAQNADALPAGQLIVGGELIDSVSVTISNQGEGVYRASCMLPPAIEPPAIVQLQVEATVDGVIGKALVWSSAVSLLDDLFESDRIIDAAASPWDLVHIKKGTGGLGVGTELLRQQLKDVAGTGITDTATIVGRIESQP
jgi:hypothetical protein